MRLAANTIFKEVAMKTRRFLISILMCLLFVVGSTIPAGALSGSYTNTVSYQGASVQCRSNISSSKYTIVMTVSFVPGSSHLPQDEYMCKVKGLYKETVSGDTHIFWSNANAMGTTKSVTLPNVSLQYALSMYYINDYSNPIDFNMFS